MNERSVSRARHEGFSLTELLVVLGVVAVLAVFAVPAYRDYVVRSRVAEGFELADASRIKVILAREDGGTDAFAKGFEVLENPMGHVTSLRWVPRPSTNALGEPVVGYLLPTMTLPGIGTRGVFALELLADGGWRCVSAAAVASGSQSQDAALDDRFLPTRCRGGASQLASHPQATPGCPQGAKLVQAADANGTMRQVCQSVSPDPQPTLQPQLQPLPQPQAQPQKQPLAQPQLAPQLQPQLQPQPQASQPAVACPVGQDCSHPDPKCPPGQQYFPGGKVPVRVAYDAFGAGGAFNTRLQDIAAMCVAKCQDGFVFDPLTPSKCGVAPATNNHTCRGPKFICERAHAPSANGSCPADAPYAANHVHNLSDGSRYVTRSCISQQEAFQADSYNKSHPECAQYSVDALQPKDFQCTFACLGDACNAETVPPSQATWGKDKDASDLPDGFVPTGKK